MVDYISNKAVTLQAFKSRSKKLQSSVDKLCYLYYFSYRFGIPAVQIRSFWRRINEIRRESPQLIFYLWLFNIGYFNNMYFTTGTMILSYERWSGCCCFCLLSISIFYYYV